MAPPAAADLLRRAYAQGWALSGGPMTDRVQAGCAAAVELGLAHLDDPRVLEATLRLGHLEGVWAQIYARRDQLHADNRTILLGMWRPMVADLSVDDIVRAAERAARGLGEAALPDLARRARQRITAAVRGIMAQVTHTGAWRQMRTAAAAAIRRALAEGRVGALAFNADQLGKVGLDWEIAFDDAYKALENLPGLLEDADSWLVQAVGDQASVLGSRLAALARAGASRGDMIDAAGDLLDEAAPVGLVVDQLTGRALTQGALDLYASEGVAQISVITAGDVAVCQQCADLEANSPYDLRDAPMVPAHPRCRCSVFAEPFPMGPASDRWFGGLPGLDADALDVGADDTADDAFPGEPEEPATVGQPEPTSAPEQPAEPLIRDPQPGRGADTRRMWHDDIEYELGRLVGSDATSAQVADAKAELVRQLRADFAGKQVATRVTPDGLSKILADGRFKTQFETGAGAAYSPETRAVIEDAMFGIPEDSDPVLRPIYGYLAMDGDGPGAMLDAYGNVRVIFKDSVRGRTTASVGDSRFYSMLPSPVDDPTWESANPGLRIKLGDDGPLRDIDYTAHRADMYVEAQIHNGVTTGDIQRVIFFKFPDEAIRIALEQQGIPWEVLTP